MAQLPADSTSIDTSRATSSKLLVAQLALGLLLAAAVTFGYTDETRALFIPYAKALAYNALVASCLVLYVVVILGSYLEGAHVLSTARTLLNRPNVTSSPGDWDVFRDMEAALENVASKHNMLYGAIVLLTLFITPALKAHETFIGYVPKSIAVATVLVMAFGVAWTSARQQVEMTVLSQRLYQTRRQEVEVKNEKPLAASLTLGGFIFLLAMSGLSAFAHNDWMGTLRPGAPSLSQDEALAKYREVVSAWCIVDSSRPVALYPETCSRLRQGLSITVSKQTSLIVNATDFSRADETELALWPTPPDGSNARNIDYPTLRYLEKQ